jgi:hypothetical protein
MNIKNISILQYLVASLIVSHVMALPVKAAEGEEEISAISTETTHKVYIQRNFEDAEIQEENFPTNKKVKFSQAPTLFGEPYDPNIGSGSSSFEGISIFSKKEEKDKQIEVTSFMVQHIQFVSSSLKLVDAAILLKVSKPKPENNQNESIATESGAMIKTELEQPGDIRNGLFLVCESSHRTYRYHAKFYQFDENNCLTEQGEESRNQKLAEILQTPPEIKMALKGAMLTHSNPNKLILSCEENDRRCLSGVQDFFGSIQAKFEQDPLATIALVAGGVARIGKAIITNGASELV